MVCAMRLLSILILLLAACDPSTPMTPRRDGGLVDGSSDGDADSDGDGISDEREGRRTGLDTDGDGTPDFRDTDSDGDGIDDADEAGDSDVSTPPRDSDFDGTPDFQDTDSDDNTILDSDEANVDSDGDGLLDFQDPDDDNDQVTDAEELRDHGPDIDSDGDGLVDFKDPDRDDDTISDGQERDADTDGDDLLDWIDLDSDADGIPDRVEAGDDDLNTPPVDTDMDMIPDFRDPDSDDDGLSDLDELTLGTNPLDSDSDGDGVSDLIESAAGTDPLDGSVNPRTEGNFVFVVPWMDDPSPLEDTLEFSTSIQFADVYFVFDRSGSMSGEINAMRAAVNTVLTNLTCTDFGVACADDDACDAGQICSLEGSCIQDPAMSTCVPSIWSGAGQYESSYGNLLSLQGNAAATGTAIGRVSTGGSDEDFFEMATCVASGTCGGGCTTASSMLGCPEFRPEAVRLLVTFSDENSDGGTLAGASGAMNASNIKFIGVWSGSSGSSARNDMINLARDTGSLSGAGTPLVFEGMDAAVSGVVTTAITEVVRGVPLRVTIEATELADDDGDALRFIDRLVVNVGGVGACTPVVDTEDTNMDGLDDAFSAVLPGTSVCWDVVPNRNDDIQEPSTSPLVYKALLTVFGDGSPLDDRTVFFLVPPRVEVPQGPQ